MITRIVKMTFRKDAVEEFKSIFEASGPQIRKFPGCTGVTLLQGADEEHVFFTYSHWNSVEDLETYRHSELFQTTWAATKLLFDDRPYAWTVNEVNL